MILNQLCQYKAALNHYFYINDALNDYNVKAVAHSDKRSENYELTLHSIPLFQFIVLIAQPATLVLVHSHCCRQPHFQPQHAGVSSLKAHINPVLATVSPQHQMADTQVSD